MRVPLLTTRPNVVHDLIDDTGFRGNVRRELRLQRALDRLTEQGISPFEGDVFTRSNTLRQRIMSERARLGIVQKYRPTPKEVHVALQEIEKTMVRR